MCENCFGEIFCIAGPQKFSTGKVWRYGDMSTKCFSITHTQTHTHTTNKDDLPCSKCGCNCTWPHSPRLWHTVFGRVGATGFKLMGRYHKISLAADASQRKFAEVATRKLYPCLQRIWQLYKDKTNNNWFEEEKLEPQEKATIGSEMKSGRQFRKEDCLLSWMRSMVGTCIKLCPAELSN